MSQPCRVANCHGRIAMYELASLNMSGALTDFLCFVMLTKRRSDGLVRCYPEHRWLGVNNFASKNDHARVCSDEEDVGHTIRSGHKTFESEVLWQRLLFCIFYDSYPLDRAFSSRGMEQAATPSRIGMIAADGMRRAQCSTTPTRILMKICDISRHCSSRMTRRAPVVP